MHTEKELLEIAKEVISKNNKLNAKLSGSLMLYNMGLNKRRNATDIDIICECLYEDPKDDGFPWIPKGFKLADLDGSRSDVNAMQFINSDGLKIEFMSSEENGGLINDIPCAELSKMVLSKLRYSKGDITIESRNKHLEDLIYLFERNHALQVF